MEIKLLLDNDYSLLINQLKQKITVAQTRARLAVNSELIQLYWSIGRVLFERQKIEAWGSKYLNQVSSDLSYEFPESKGFSRRNLERMRQFYLIYQVEQIAAQPVSQLPWGHIIYLIQKVKYDIQREWYIQQTITQGWSRKVLSVMIDQDLYRRQTNSSKITNFKNTLTSTQSELAQNLFKDPYCFEFLALKKPLRERDIEIALVHQIRDFLLELGQGFAFMGNQYHLNVGGDDFYIDCLFYNVEMRCYVVVELKSGKFKPEYTGQLNFYLTAIDQQIKKDTDNPTIGILLCETKNKIVAQYAVDGMTKPMGISQYELSEALTQRIKRITAEDNT
ncbi:MAG: PDDEXK nuclease domain-containing protein [Coxiellaceae bacterium]|nr:PDDEXK nuclease domain-containing protein [Coxiellaceae bacterium]